MKYLKYPILFTVNLLNKNSLAHFVTHLLPASSLEVTILLKNYIFCDAYISELKKHFQNTTSNLIEESYFLATSKKETFDQFILRLICLDIEKCVSNNQKERISFCYAEEINGLYNSKVESKETVVVIDNEKKCIINVHST